MANKLTRKQEIFVAEYCVDSDGKRAAIAAGYSAKTAESQASQLLKHPKVSAAIAKKTQKILNKLEISAEKVLNEIALLGFSNMMDYIGVHEGDAFVDLSALDRDKAAAIQEITVEEYTEGRGEDARNIKRTKFKLSDKKGSLELLGKHLKLFTDKVEHSGEIAVASLTDEERAAKIAAIMNAAKSRKNGK